MQDAQSTADEWLPIVRAEYREMPGLQLTRSQVKRMWNLDESICAAVLSALVDERFLWLTSDGRYAWAEMIGRRASAVGS